jgi:phage-related protein
MGFADFISDAWDAVKSGARKIGNAVKEGLKWSVEKAKGAFDVAKGVVSTVYKDAKSAVSTVYTDAKNRIDTIVNRGFDSVEGLLNSPITWIGLPLAAVGAYMVLSKKG